MIGLCILYSYTGMIGLCGDCDGRSNDLRTLDGQDVSGMPNMFGLISQSFTVDESVDSINEAFGLGNK